MIYFCAPISRVLNWFTKSQAIEVETAEPVTAEGRRAQIETECCFAEGAYDAAVTALRAYNDAHRQIPFSYTTGDVTRIVTMVNDSERRRLERDVRAALARRNRAWEVRAVLLRSLGIVH